MRWHPPSRRFGAASAQRDTALGAEATVKHPKWSTRPARRKRRRRCALPRRSTPRGNLRPSVPWSAAASTTRHRFGRRSHCQTLEVEHTPHPAKASSPLRSADALHTARQLASERPLECGGKHSTTPLWAPKPPSNTQTGAHVQPGERVVAAPLCRGAPHRAATRVRAPLGALWHPPSRRFGAASAQRDTALGAEAAVKHPTWSTRPTRRKRRRHCALPRRSTPRGNLRPSAPWSAVASAA